MSFSNISRIGIFRTCERGTGERGEKMKIGDRLIRHIHACYIERRNRERREERGEWAFRPNRL